MELVNKKAIADAVAEKHNLTKKETLDIVDLVFDTIAQGLKDGGRVDITGFGKFEVRERSGRTGVNPRTLEPIEIEGSRVPKFKASKVLKERVK